jgi:CO/xanthine dehydrogenase Mo-binding subunit
VPQWLSGDKSDVEVLAKGVEYLGIFGAGEPSNRATAAAIANAIFDATGARVRQMPLTPQRVKAALSASQPS